MLLNFDPASIAIAFAVITMSAAPILWRRVDAALRGPISGARSSDEDRVMDFVINTSNTAGWDNYRDSQALIEPLPSAGRN